MAIRSRVNQYRGINAHFQSYAQHERDGWVAFHNTHITHLCEAIDLLLPPGYEVVPERSLQIRTVDPHTGQLSTRKPEPDVTIWDTDLAAQRTKSSFSAQVAVPVATKPVIATLMPDEETRLKAVVIKELLPTGEAVPVTRIELLSPTNKVGEDRGRYLAKREAALEAGLVLVEVDYIHEIDSPIPQTPGYASRDPGAYPYTILVSDPRPSLEEGQTRVYGFYVDEAMPPIEIPLTGQENIVLNFARVYDRTFSSLSTFSNRADYAKEPIHFQSYAPEDQQRIWARMLAVMDAERAGLDLENAPFPVSEDEPVFTLLRQEHPVQVCMLVDESTLEACWLVVREGYNLLLFSRTQSEILMTGEESVILSLYQTLKDTFETEGAASFREKLKR